MNLLSPNALAAARSPSLTVLQTLGLALTIALGATAGPAPEPESPGMSPSAPGAEAVVHQVKQLVARASQVALRNAQLTRELAPRTGDLPAERLAPALAEAQAAHELRRKELADLKAALAELRAGRQAERDGNPDELQARIQEWERKLEEARREFELLAGLEADLILQLDRQKKSTGVAAETFVKKKQIIVTVRRNLVAPTSEPYFTKRVGRLANGGAAAELRPAQDGVTLGAAFAPDGWLAKQLDKTDPEQAFTAFLVAPDSIATYYAAVAELRGRKFSHTWFPWDGEAFVVSLGGATDPIGVRH